MTILRKPGLRGLNRIFFIALFALQPTIVNADSPIAAELNRVRTANRTLERLANARLELEIYCLNQLGMLRRNGQASWLELARQQVVVKSLTEQLGSLKHFIDYVDDLEDRANFSVSYAELEQDVIRVDERVAGYTNVITDNSQIELAVERLRRADARYQHILGSDILPAQWQQQAQLQRDIAQAELAFIQLQQSFKREIRTTKGDSNSESLRFLIDLRRHYFDLEGRRHACSCKLELRRTCLKKLEEAVARSTVLISPHESPDTVNLRATLAAGEKNQLESLQTNIEVAEAELLEFDEILSDLSLQEARVRAVNVHQVYKLSSSHVSTMIGTDSSRDPADDFRVATNRPEYLNFSLGRRDKSPLIYRVRYSMGLPQHRFQVNGHGNNGIRGGAILQTGNRKVDSGRALAEADFRNSTFSSHAIYPFGILRNDFRIGAPTGQIPWYLPGSPTNLRSRQVLE